MGSMPKDLDQTKIAEILRILDDEPPGTQPEAIALKVGLPVTAVATIVEERSSPKKKEETAIPAKVVVLKEQLEMLRELYEIAFFEYKDEPIDRNAVAVTSLMNSTQMIIKELEGCKDNTFMMKEILRLVIQPLVRGLIESVSDEARNVRTELFKQLPIDQHGHVDHAIKELVKSYGASSKNKYEEAVDKLASNLGVEKNEGKVILMNSVPKDG